MLNLQDQSGRPRTVLREPCAVSHDEETLHVSTTACVEKNISTQESMFHSNSVQETETAITTLVENHQTDAAATGSAYTILSTMSSMKLRDIMDKMTSCLFGWSWRRVSVFHLTGKNTDAENLTVCIPCTDIVLATVQELFFPCSLMEDTNSYNQGVEELMAIPPQTSLAELELCLRLAGIYDITACLSVIFRPECIVHVDCSVENFEAIADRMRDIGLPLPIRSPASTLAIMSHQYSTVQEDQTVECDSREMALSLLEDTTDCNQVQVIQSMVIETQPSTAELELRLQLPGVGDITDNLRVVFRPECIVQVDCSMVNFEAIADHMRDIGVRLPTRSTDSTLAIMSPQSLTVEEVLTSEVQPVDCDNYEMALVVPQGAMQLINQEAVEHSSLPALTAVEEAKTVDIDEICSLFASMSGYNTKQLSMKSTSKVLKGSEIFFGKAVVPRAFEEQNHVQDLRQGNTASTPNKVQIIESLTVQCQLSTAELELRLQLPEVCNITAHLRVVFRPECIVQVDLSILRFETIGDGIREIDLQLPMDAIASALGIMSPQSIALQEVVTSEVQCDEHANFPALAAVEAEKFNIDDICSPLASMSGHEIFFGKAVQRGTHDDVQEKATIRHNEVQMIKPLFAQPEPGTVELELRLQLPEVCNITAHLCVLFRPECIVQVELSILRFETIGDNIREIDLQLPMDAIASALGIMSPQSIALQKVVTSEDYPAEQSSISVLPAGEKAESIDIEKVRPLHAAITGHNLSKTKTSKDVAISKESEIFFGKTIRKEQENDIRDTSSSNNEVQVLQSMVVQSRPNVTELELRLQLPGVCDITGRLRVEFRPECIVQIDFSILRFEALSDDIREIDLQLPIDAIANALATVSSQPIIVQEVTTSEVQPVEHSSIPAQPPEGKAKTLDIKEFYSLLASMSSHAEESSHDVHELKGSAILCELETAPSREELEDIVAIEPAEVLKTLDNANNLENAVYKKANVTAQRDLQLKEPVNALPIVPTEGIELQHVVILGLQEVSIEKQPTTEQTVSEITVSSPSTQEVQASCSVNTVYQAIQTEHVHQTSNVLEEVVAREIREIRETVDNTVGGILDVPLERPTARRRRKRSHADDGDDNQLLSKDSESEERVAKDLVDEMQESPLVTNGAQRYPSDVYQALLTQTVYLLERGIVLLSDDGSFIAVANPSSASRIGDALTGNNFAKNFHRYDNDVLPQDLKQKVIERAALVAREHQDRVLEGMVERPIFTLSEIRHYDCNGDYIMKDVSSPNTPMYPFTGIQPTPVYQGFVNPFLTGMTTQGLLTADTHTSFQMLQQYEYINDIEMVDVDELYMDIDESIDDMFMECDDQEDCPYCSQINLSLFESLPTKYAIRKRAIYSLLDKRPLNPEIQYWKINQRIKKSWFAYNSFSFRPEFDQPLGGLSLKDRVTYSLLDERPLNPALAPSLAIQDKSKSWFAYNTFSFREGDLVPVGSYCDCMQTTTAVESWPNTEQVGNPVFPVTSEENIATTKPPFNTFSFRPEDYSCQQASIVGGRKQESVFSFGKTEKPVLPTEPETISSGISCKDFSFREEDDSQTEADKSCENDLQLPDVPWKPETQPVTKTSPEISWKDFSFREEDDPLFQAEADKSCENDLQLPDIPWKPETQPVLKTSPEISWKDFSFREEDDPLFQAEADKSYETKQQPNDLSLEPVEKQSVKKETLIFSCEQGEETAFPVSEDSDATSSEAESHDDDLFDLNDENEEQTIKEIIAAVKSKLDESRMYYPPQEDVARVSSKGETVKIDETASEEEPVNKQGFADRQSSLEAKGDEDKTLKDRTAPSKEIQQVSKDPPQAAKHEKTSSLESREPASKLTISHSKSINKRSEPYPTQAVSGLAAFMRRRVKMVERDRLKTLQVLTQATLEHKDTDSSGSVPALPADNAQQRKEVSLKSLTGNTKTNSSSRPDLAITIGPSDAHERKVVSLKSLTWNTKTKSSSKADLAITIGQSDAQGRQVVSSRTLVQDKKSDLPTAPSVQSDVNSSNKKIPLKSLTQTKKKEADVKGSEMDRLNSRHQSKDAEVLGKPTPVSSAVSAAQSLESSTKHDSVEAAKYFKTAVPPKETIPSKPLPAVKVEESRIVSLRSLNRGSKYAASSASTVAESRTEKVFFKKTDAKGKELESNKISTSKTKVSDAKNSQLLAMGKVTAASDMAETGSARKVAFELNQERPMEDAMIEISPTPSIEKKPKMESSTPSTTVEESCSVKAVDFKIKSMKEDEVIKSSIEPAPCEQTLKEESHSSSVAGPSCAKTVDLRSKLTKKDTLKKTSTEPASCEANKKLSSLKKESLASTVQCPRISSKKGELRSISKKDDLKMLSTKPASCEANKKLSSLKKESLAFTVQCPRSSKKVDLRSISKKDDLKMTSTEPASCEKKTKETSLKKAPNASSGPEHCSVKAVELTSSAARKEGLTKSSPSTKPVSCIRNVNVASLKSVAQTSSVQMHGSTKEVELTSTTPQKEGLAKSSPSTKPVSCIRKVNVASLKSVAQTSSVQMHGSTKEVELTSTTPQKEDQTKSSSSTKLVKIPANVVPLRSVSQDEKDGPLSKPSSSTSPSSSNEQVNQLKMSSKSVTKREWAVPVRKSSGPVKISVPLMEACAVTPKSVVKIDGSAKKHGQQQAVIQPSSSEKHKTFESLTFSHKRELDEMLDEDRQSDKERMRNLTSRAGQKSSRKTTRKDNVQPKSVSNYNSGNDYRKNTSEAVKLVKTDVVQDTSVAKGSPVTKEELQPISLTVDVNKVKDAKNESTPQRVPTTLKEAKPSPERRVAVTDVSNSDITLSRQGTLQQSSQTSLAAVGTDGVGVCGGSAVQSSPAIPDPRPLLPAEAAEGIVAGTMDTVNVLQSSPNTAPTTPDPSPVNDPETVSEEASNMAGSAVQTKDISETPCLPEPQQSASMNLVDEPLLDGVVAIFGEHQANPKKIPEEPVPKPAAENVTSAGKRKLQDMQQEEDEKNPSLAEEKPVEVRKKRRWRTEEKPPLKQEEQPNKPRRRIIRNMFKKG